MTARAPSKPLTGLILGLLLSLFLSSGFARAEAGLTPEGAAGFIEGLANETLTVLSDRSLEPEVQARQVKVIIDRGFDLPLISRFVLGRFWRSATEAQRLEYQQLFRRGVVESYTRALVSAGGTGFQILDSVKVSKTDVLVNSRLERAEGPPIGAGWRVRSRWRTSESRDTRYNDYLTIGAKET